MCWFTRIMETMAQMKIRKGNTVDSGASRQEDCRQIFDRSESARQMQLAEEIMYEDRKILRALGR